MMFSVRGASYAYEISGDGPPVLLLHGFTGTQKTWTQLRNRLTEEFQVITIDLPGHGKTNSSRKTMKQCCEDLAEFLAHLKIDQAHVIGYSMGGRVALSFAMYYPQLVASLVLESSSPGKKTEQERKERAINDEKLASKLEAEGIEEFVKFWENIPLFDTQRQLPADVQQRICDERLNQRKEGLADSLRSMGTGSQPSWWNHLIHVNIPVLLIVGELDHKFVRLNEQMEKKMQQAQLTIVSDAGHAVHVEQPENFGTLVVSFLKMQTI